MTDANIADLALRNLDAHEQLPGVGDAANLCSFLKVIPDQSRQVFAEDRARERRDQIELRSFALQ